MCIGEDVGGGYGWEEDVAGFGEILVELCGRESRRLEGELRRKKTRFSTKGMGRCGHESAEECRRAMDIMNAGTRKIKDSGEDEEEESEEEEEKEEEMIALGSRLFSRRSKPQSMPDVLQLLLTWKQQRRTCQK